ncbi:hypothetical protein MMC17_009245 [Xylographa soralifera]|nr:hypothetical protein [Xylographa soralifera]
MAFNRSKDHNVHIYNIEDPTIELGGLILTTGVTNANFFSMLEILFFFESRFNLRDKGGITVERNDHPLQPGDYYIVGPLSINNEPWLVRTISLSTGTCPESFRNAVRARDKRCVITGQESISLDNWTGLQAAHIFPLAYLGHWVEHNYGRWITVQTEQPINSVQNGLLLRSDIHQLFDMYFVSINPDDNYKLIWFTHDRNNLAGRYLDQQFLNNPSRPVDQLLRWHFRQAVLANMRGVGEPIFEHDFPPGSDMVGEIWRGPKAAERMEFELYNRLAIQ